MIYILYTYLVVTYILGIIGGIMTFRDKQGMSLISNLFIVLISPIIMPWVIYTAYKIHKDRTPKIG